MERMSLLTGSSLAVDEVEYEKAYTESWWAGI